MVKVYFEMEHPKAAELVAIFDTEETYDVCFPALDKMRQENGWDYITESVEEEDL